MSAPDTAFASTNEGVVLVPSSLELGVDPHALHEIDYICLHRAISALDRPVKIADPRDFVALQGALASAEYPLVLTIRSQSKDWQLPSPGTAEFEAVRAKTLITLAGNPPYYQGSFGFHQSVFQRKLTVLSDHDSFTYAESINISGARLLPHQPAFHDFALEDEADWLPTSKRPIPVLFVGSYTDPESLRIVWRQIFARFPGPLASIEAATEMLASNLRLPVWQALEQASTALKVDFDLRSRAGRIALELLTKFANHSVRKAALERIARYPSLIITGEMPEIRERHKACAVLPPVSFGNLLNMMKQTRCVVTTNPNGMTGAISERVPNAMRRGAVVVHAPNNVVGSLHGVGVELLGNALEGLDDRLDAAATGDGAWDSLGEMARAFAAAHFRMDDVFDAVLRTAADPKFWAPPLPSAER